MNLLDLMVKIGVDDQASAKIKDMGSRVKSGLATVAKAGLAATAAAGAAVVGVGKMAIDAYAQFEQLEGGVKKLFGPESAQIVINNAQQAFKTAGMSANQYMEQATGFAAALIQSCAGDTVEAANLADVAMRAMSDNVNTFGTDMESVQYAFQGFAKQNYTMLDNLKLGYGGTKEEMQRLVEHAASLNEIQEELGLTVEANSLEFANLVKAIQVVQTEQGIAGTTAKEAMTTIEGAINMTKAAWQNLLAELGKDDGDVIARMNELVESATIALLGYVDDNGQKVSQGILGRLKIIIEQLAAALPEALPRIQEALTEIIQALVPIVVEMTPLLLEAFIMLFTAILDGLANVSPEVTEGLMQLLVKLGETIIQYAPQLLAAAGMLVLGIAKGIVLGIMPAMEAMNEVGQGILDAIGTFFMGCLEAGRQLIDSIVQGAQQTAGNMISFFGQAVSNAWQAVCNFFGNMNSAGQQLIDNIIQGAASIGSNIATSVTEFIQGAVDAVGDFFGAMFDAGAHIIDGLIQGIQSAIGGAVAAVGDGLSSIREMLPFSPAKKGPFSGKGWTLYSGRSLMRGLADGISDGAEWVDKAMSEALDGLDASRSSAMDVMANATVSASAGAEGGSSALSDRDRAFIDWLESFLPMCIANYTPTMDDRTFGRAVRKAAV